MMDIVDWRLRTIQRRIYREYSKCAEEGDPGGEYKKTRRFANVRTSMEKEIHLKKSCFNDLTWNMHATG